MGNGPCTPRHGCPAIWGSVEYLLWWEQDSKYPPLVTTSPNGTPRGDAGVLGFDTTSVLFGGDQPLDNGALSGGRLTLGLWIDPAQRTSIAGREFSIEDHGSTFAAVSEGNDILARPFFNAFTNEADALLLGFPGDISGNIEVSQNIQTEGAQAFFRHLFRSGCNYRIDLVLGYRYIRVDESISIDNSLEFINETSNLFGTTIDQQDLFDVNNEFHGGELGFMGHSQDGRWTLDFLATLALGSMRQRAAINGSTVSTPLNGDPASVVGGLLTQSTNIGTYSDDPIAVVPEATVTLGYFVTPRLDLSVGYSFLYMNHVSRPGDIIDTSVNLTQQTGNLEGPARPAFEFRDSDYWLQGLNFGVNLRY